MAHLVAFPVAWNISSEERWPGGLLRSSCDVWLALTQSSRYFLKLVFCVALKRKSVVSLTVYSHHLKMEYHKILLAFERSKLMIIEHFKSFYPHFQIDPKSIYCIKIVKIWCLTTIYCVYLRFNTRILFIPESTEGVAEGQTTAMANKQPQK